MVNVETTIETTYKVNIKMKPTVAKFLLSIYRKGCKVEAIGLMYNMYPGISLTECSSFLRDNS